MQLCEFFRVPGRFRASWPFNWNLAIGNDPTRSHRQHDHTISEQDRFFDAVRNEENRSSIGLPHFKKIVLQDVPHLSVNR
jgi:hypothetical protein